MKTYMLLLDVGEPGEYWNQIVKADSFEEALNKGYQVNRKDNNYNEKKFPFKEYLEEVDCITCTDTGDFIVDPMLTKEDNIRNRPIII